MTLAARTIQLKLCNSFSYVNQFSIAVIANLIHRVPPLNLDTYAIFPLSNCSHQSICVFSNHTIYLWNNLPDSVVHSKSIVTFKHSLQLCHCQWTAIPLNDGGKQIYLLVPESTWNA